MKTEKEVRDWLREAEKHYQVIEPYRINDDLWFSRGIQEALKWVLEDKK